VTGTAETISLWPRSVFEVLEPGSLLTIDFDGAVLRVEDSDASGCVATVVAGGRVHSNKAVTVDPAPALPALTDADLQAIEIGVRLGIEHFALSFAAAAEDVDRLGTLVGDDAYIISKIESRAGVHNMENIILASDAVLIDRGDLSREVPLERVPAYQKEIIRQANCWSSPVFVATNLLESMIVNRGPTIAEANDIINTLCDGAHGLVLAAETAVGMHPVAAVDMIVRMIEAFEWSTGARLLEQQAPSPVGLLRSGMSSLEAKPKSAHQLGA
jgi:pyruvate kinase